jgi:hypothetical protein
VGWPSFSRKLAKLVGYRSVKNPCIFLPQVKKITFKYGELRGFYFVPPNRGNLVDFFPKYPLGFSFN